MGLLDLFKNLVNEHGSAEVLRQRLELQKEQSQAEIAELKKMHEREIESLKAQITDLKNQNEKLRKRDSMGGLVG